MNVEVNETLSVVLIVLAALTLVASPVALGFLIQWLRSRVKSDKLESLITIVYEAVKGAEGQFPGDGNGVSKKAYVMDVLRWAANDLLGTGVSDEFLSTLVESAVYWLFNRSKEPTSAIEPASATLAYKGK